ncbi:hypothetical protein ACFPRL_28510 [Pseudoclavibacter helvolus]
MSPTRRTWPSWASRRCPATRLAAQAPTSTISGPSSPPPSTGARLLRAATSSFRGARSWSSCGPGMWMRRSSRPLPSGPRSRRNC